MGCTRSGASRACPSNKLCAAVDNAGNAIISTHPTGGVSAWKRKHVDSNPILNGISCLTSLCVAVDSAGAVVFSTNPASQTPTWSSPVLIDPLNSVQGISCPSTTLCVAVDNAGQVVTSTDPTGAANTWSAALVGSGSGAVIKAVSCPSTSFCMAVDNDGNSISSTNPAGGASAWNLHTGVASTNRFNAVSCPSTKLCAGVDETPHGGDIVTSTTPTTPTPWKVQFADGNFNTLFGVSCPAPSLCVAVDDNHRVFTSSHPSGGKSAWSTQSIDFRWSLLNVSCSPKGLCVTGDQGGNVVAGQLPPPNTQITNAAISKSNRAATFKFKALGLSSGFQCALHKKAVKAKFSPCGSPKSYTNLSRGTYTFEVRAFNLAGRDPSPASNTFTL